MILNTIFLFFLSLFAPAIEPVSTGAKNKSDKAEPVGAIVMEGTSVDGLIVKKAKRNCQGLSQVAVKILEASGLKVFSVIDHSEGAKKAGFDLPSSTVISFGNPKVGSPVMLNSPTAGIDLPMKMHLHELNGVCHVTYNDPEYIRRRHHAPNLPEFKKMSAALDKITNELSKNGTN